MTAVIAENISKRYQINVGPSGNTLSGRLRSFIKREQSATHEELWALRDVSFDVEEGEVFGIIGRNGSGKSTLLKILTGIVRPTYGSAFIRGRVGALLEVGTGFHPDLTGRENVFFNGTLLGLDRAFIQSKFDEIVAFAEVEKFIDTQFKHYSSGMQARLGFAVAVNLRPEVLILDEVLSVGDVMFQEKSMDRMTELRKSGITILFVSHSLSSVAGICKRAMLLKHGQLIALGNVGEVVEEYMPKPVMRGMAKVDYGEGSNHAGCFLTVTLENEDGRPTEQFDITESIFIRVRYRVSTPLNGFVLGLRIHTHFEDITVSYMTDEHQVIGMHEVGVFEKTLKLRPMFLKEGEYSITLEAGVPRFAFDLYERALKFWIVSNCIDMTEKSYRRDRSGKVICQGTWIDRPVSRDRSERTTALARRRRVMGIDTGLLDRIEQIGKREALFAGSSVLVLGDCKFYTAWASGDNRKDLARFQQLFGLGRIETVDIVGDPTIRLDLQKPLPSNLAAQFDVVLDAGTLFWCFDIAAVLANCLSMLRDRGTMMHVCALTGHFGRGYYNIHPKLFRDFYQQNGFEMLSTEVRVHKQMSRLARLQKRLWEWRGRPVGEYLPIGKDALFLKSADFVSMEFTDEVASNAAMLPNDALLLCAAKRERRMPFVRPIP